MDNYLKPPIKVPFDDICLDPNNPRLAPDDAPGYDDPVSLVDEERQKIVQEQLADLYNVDDLKDAILAQGWMPIDNIVTWSHPDATEKHVVVEGNTRILALRQLRRIHFEREQKKLARMENGRYAEHDVEAQRQLVDQIKRIVEDTDQLSVVPLDADTVEDLKKKLPRVLAVRHITGVKVWGNYAEDLWLLQRYQQLFDERYPDSDMKWEGDLIKQTAEEASLTPTKAKRQLKAASCFSHFKAEFEDRMPGDEEFKPSDYYLFENIVKYPFVRAQFELSDDDLNIAPEKEEVLFDWVFKFPRGIVADENPNIFYRHENVVIWDRMKKYDDNQGTSFASRLDVNNHREVPTMQQIEIEYLAHKARQKPQELIDELLRRLKDISAETLAEEGEFIKSQLQQLRKQSDIFLKMIEAIE